MEELPRFSAMLAERREALGLTVEQASRVLKLKPSVLIAFEQGDFSSIPQSGYAQGMLSSYSRYLGLNPRELVDQFQEDLYEHEHGFGSHELKRRTRESRGVNADSTGNFPALVSQRGRMPRRELKLPSIDDAGDNSSFDTTSQVRLRTDAWRESAASASIGAERPDTSAYPQGRPYTARTSYGENSAQRARALTRGERPRARYDVGAADTGEYRRGDVTTMDVARDEYRDDLVLEQRARPYEAASTATARRAMASEAPQRPNVRRRDPQAQRGKRRRGNGGILSDSRMMMLIILGLLALILIVLVAMSARSCVSSLMGGQTTSSVTVITPSSGDGSSSETSGSESADAPAQTQQEGQPISSTTATETEPAEQKKEVTVRVEDGQVSWVEINSDGTSLVAATITGPWEQSFTVETSATIQVGSTSAVTVLCNNETMRFDERSSGVGSITIEGPGASATTDIPVDDGSGEASGENGEGEGSDGSGDYDGSDGYDESGDSGY